MMGFFVYIIKKSGKKPTQGVNIRTKALKIKEFRPEDHIREDDVLTVTIPSFAAGETATVSVVVVPPDTT